MTNEKSTAKTKDEMRWAMVRPELEAVLEEMWLARVLPLDFGAALERLRLWREMSQEELARDAECPVRTIRRLENGETKRPQLETVVRLCVALSLRWRLGEALLVRCGWVLRAGVYEDEVLRYVLERGGYGFRPGNMDDHWYAYVLMYKYADPVDEVNAFLREQGATPLF